MIYYIEELLWGVPLTLVLIFTHIYFSFKVKFPQRYMLRGLRWIFFSSSNADKNKISSFKTLMSVLASTIGTGNIIGVATAIIIGGPGSLFWIFISGVFAIATKYSETFLVLKYRGKINGKRYGGTMYVLRDVLCKNKLGIIFSILIIFTSFGMGAMIQSNAISNSILQNYQIDKRIIGIIVVCISSYILFGNEKRIANFSSILMPIAIIAYIVSCIWLSVLFKDNLLNSIKLIIKEAFNLKSVSGGIFSSTMIKAMSVGLSKGLFTNEAGMGTSPLFDAMSDEENIKKQSIISSTAVFIDTVVICTITGILFVSSDMYHGILNPVKLSMEIFAKLPLGNYLYMFFISIFALSSIPCSGFYGSVGVRFLFKNKRICEYIYKIIFIVFIYIGTKSTISFVWSFSSICNALLVIPNLYMLYKLKEKID